MKTVSIALIGCGAWGMNHLRVWSKLGLLRVVCDPDAGRLDTVRSQYPDIEVCTDTDDVFRRSDIDAVVIAAPAAQHLALTLQALEAGKDVLVEKPMALTVAEGQQMVAVARRVHRILMVGHVLEFHPAIAEIRRLVANGMLGQVRYIYSNRLNLGRIRTEENALWSFAPHDIAIILRILGTVPDEVACHGEGYLNREIADVTLTALHFPNHIRAHIFVSWLHPFKEQRFVVVGERQMAVFDDMSSWDEKLVLYPHTVDWRDGRVPVVNRAEGIPVPLQQVEPLLAECEHFVDAIASRSEPLTNAESGLRVLQILEAAQHSLEHGSVPTSSALMRSDPSFFVHPSATVDPGAVLGPGTKVWHYSHVMPTAIIGRNCILAQNVFVANNVRIGDGVKIQNNVSVYEGVELEDFVFCGPSMVFTNVMNPRSGVERKKEFRRTLVRRGASLGANSTIICGTTIGAYAFVGAGAVVTRNVPDYALVVGTPARIIGWVCECGEKLTFDEEQAVCRACGKPYRRSPGNQVQRENRQGDEA